MFPFADKHSMIAHVRESTSDLLSEDTKMHVLSNMIVKPHPM